MRILTYRVPEQHAAYIQRLLRRCPWEEANPILEEMVKQFAEQLSGPAPRNGTDAALSAPDQSADTQH